MADYKNQKIELENLNLKNENDRKEGLIRENKLRSRLFLLGLISAIITLLLLLWNFNQKNELNKKLKEVNNSLNASNQELERFAHMASHDLKSPLRTITSFSSLLQRKLKNSLELKDQEYLNYIATSGKNLSYMIDDILAYSKEDSQNIVKQEVNVDTMLEDLMFALKDQTDSKSIILERLTPFPNAIIDRVKLMRVFQNIASNAIKFCDALKDKKYIRFSYKEKDKFHQFSISDNGIGIPETEKNIFQPFTYLNSKDEYRGTGMGLAMCQKIIEKHGGEIWYESEVGVGTVFHFTVKKA